MIFFEEKFSSSQLIDVPIGRATDRSEHNQRFWGFICKVEIQIAIGFVSNQFKSYLDYLDLMAIVSFQLDRLIVLCGERNHIYIRILRRREKRSSDEFFREKSKKRGKVFGDFQWAFSSSKHSQMCAMISNQNFGGVLYNWSSSSSSSSTSTNPYLSIWFYLSYKIFSTCT